ncbi:MAG: acyltransferase family protein, partial [Bacteroidia bacterium]
MNQVPVLDSLRAIAAWSVCLYHFVCSTIGLFAPGRLTDAFYYGQYGIHVFFVISGFVIPWSMYHSGYRIGSFFKFVAKRFTRIEPPYIASIILVLLIVFVKSRMGYGTADAYGQSVTPARVFLHLGYLINFFPQYAWLNGVYWTLAIEFQYYLIMALMFLLFVHPDRLIRYLAYALCFAMSLLVPDVLHAHFPFYAPLFLFGIIVFLKMTSRIAAAEFWA